MARLLNKINAKQGTAPGSLIFVGIQKLDATLIDAIRYNKDQVEHHQKLTPQEAKALLHPDWVVWINVTGVHDADTMAELRESFKLHPLFAEDVMNTNQRPKFSDFEDHLAVIVKMLHINTDLNAVESEQLSIACSTGLVITFQEAQGDVFDPIRERILRPTTRIRHRGPDYMLFVLLDTIVDQYIASIEFFGDAIEQLEERLLKNVEKSDIHRINRFKREITQLRKSIRPVLDIALHLERNESELIERETLPFIKELNDHMTQAVEAMEIYRDMLADEAELYNSSMTHRLNDIMRVLTVFSVIFIPLTFLAGVYGANFEYMPELGYKYAYAIFWAVLISIALVMLSWFYRKRWL